MKLLTALVMLYLLLDVCDPHLPGALEFDPDASVEVVRLDRASDTAPAPLVQIALRSSPERVVDGTAVAVDRRPVSAPVTRRSVKRPAPDPGAAEDA